MDFRNRKYENEFRKVDELFNQQIILMTTFVQTMQIMDQRIDLLEKMIEELKKKKGRK